MSRSTKNKRSISKLSKSTPSSLHYVGSSETLAHFVPAQTPPRRRTKESQCLGVSFDSSTDDSSSPLHGSSPHIVWDRSSSGGSPRLAKSSSFMKIIKKAKLGSFRSKSVERLNSQSPPPQPSSPPPKSGSPASSPSPSSNILQEGYHDERSLIRIWADQVDGGVEGYKGFLIRPDTTTRELLTTVHTKICLSGHPTDYFLCATFQSDDIPDRPLMNAERPLYLHNQWCQSYRFELRHKPTVIIMVYGGARLASRSVPFIRGAVEVTEDAPTWRFITELCRRYDLDTNERYNIVERLGGSERILHSDERPALCQKRWKPHQDGQFVLIHSLTSTNMNINSSFTDMTPLMKVDRSLSTDSSSSITFPTDISSSFYVPDFESADHATLDRSASSDLLASESIVSYCSSNTKHILNIGIPQENINIGFQEMHDRWYSNPLPGNPRKRTSSSEDRSIERFLFSDDKEEQEQEEQEQEEEQEEKESIHHEKFDIMCGLRPLSQETSGSFDINIYGERKSHSSDEITLGDVTINPPSILLDIVDTSEPSEQSDSPRSVPGTITLRNLSSVSLQMSWDNFDNDIVTDTQQQRAHIALQEEIKKRVEGETEGKGEEIEDERREEGKAEDKSVEDETTNEIGSISTVLLEQSMRCYEALENKADKAQEKLIGQLTNANVILMTDHDIDNQDNLQDISLSSSTRTLYDLSLEEDDYISSFHAGNSLLLNAEHISAVDGDNPIVRNANIINPVSLDNINLDLEYPDKISPESSSDITSINSDSVDSVTSLNGNNIPDDSVVHTLTSSLKSYRPRLQDSRQKDRSRNESDISHGESDVSNIKEALERMRNEIDEVLDDYNESYPTSLDSSRHEFSDSPYGDLIENTLDFTSTSENSNLINPDKSHHENSQIFDTVESSTICESSDIGVLIEDPYIEDDMIDISEIIDLQDSSSYTSDPSNYTMSVSLTYLSDNESIDIDSQCNIEVGHSDEDSPKYISPITDQPTIAQLWLALDDRHPNILFQDETCLRSRSIEFSQLKNIFDTKGDSPHISSSQPSLGPDMELSITSFGPDDESENSEENEIIYADYVNLVHGHDTVNTANDVRNIVEINVVKDDVDLGEGVVASVIDAVNVAKGVVGPDVDVVITDVTLDIVEIDDDADAFDDIDRLNAVAINAINLNAADDADETVTDVVEVDNDDDRAIEGVFEYTDVTDNVTVVSANIINVTASEPHVESVDVVIVSDGTIDFPDVDVFANAFDVANTLDDAVVDLVNINAANDAAEPILIDVLDVDDDRVNEINGIAESFDVLSVNIVNVTVSKDVYEPSVESVDVAVVAEGDDVAEAFYVADTLDLVATDVININAANNAVETIDDIIDVIGVYNENDRVIEIEDVSKSIDVADNVSIVSVHVIDSTVSKDGSGSLAESTDDANASDITVHVVDIDSVFEASYSDTIEGIAVDLLNVNTTNDAVETINDVLDVVDMVDVDDDNDDDNISSEIESVYESIDIDDNVTVLLPNVSNVTVSKDASGLVDDVVEGEDVITAAVIDGILDFSHISSYVPADEINVDTFSAKDAAEPANICEVDFVGDVHDVDVTDITSAKDNVQSAVDVYEAVDDRVDDITNVDYISNGVDEAVYVEPVVNVNEDDTDCIHGICPETSTLCEKLKNLKASFRNKKFRDEEGYYEIKLPCIWEITDEEDTTSPPLSKLMAHADLKRQYKNLLAEIEETKPKLRQLEVLQGELSSMQKAYHELKEQALRMSAEQEMQKSQIEEEIKKLKISNQDLVQKTKDSKAEAVVSTIMELEKLYSDRITALEKALRQKDAMVGDLEEQNRNMMTQLNLNRRQSVQLETANELLHKRNEVLHVERSEGEINPAQFFDSDNQRLALLAKQCDALQQTVSSLESTLVLRVKELNETYKDLDEMRSDLRSAEVARIEAEAQLDVHKREVARLSSVNEDFATEIKQRIADNGKLEQDNRHLNENLESIQLQYKDTKDRVSRLENALLSQEKALNAYKDAEKGARCDLTNIEKRLEMTSQEHRAREDEIKKLRKEVEKAKKGTSMYNLCNAVKPGETLELISVDLPAVTEHIPRGLYLKQGANGVYLDKIDLNTSAGRLHRLSCGDKVVEINLQDVSNATFEAIKKDFDSPRAMQLVVARIAPDVREESKLRAEALKDQMTALVVDLDKTAKLCQSLQGDVAGLKNELVNVKAKQKSELESAGNQKNLEELHALKALLTQKDQYLKTLETTVKSKNELLVTLEMDSHRSPRPTPNTSVNRSSSLERSRANGTKQEHSNSISELVNRYG